jgi:hypothetical protein
VDVRAAELDAAASFVEFHLRRKHLIAGQHELPLCVHALFVVTTEANGGLARANHLTGDAVSLHINEPVNRL